MRSELLRIHEAEKDFPTFQGMVTCPDYLPEAHRDGYIEAIFAWTKTHERRLWPGWLVRWLSTYRPTVKGNP